MFCPTCGKEVPDNLTYCSFCGGVLKDSAETSYSAYSSDPTAYSAPNHVPGKGLGITSMILGIMSHACCGSIFTAIIGLILGLIARSQAKKAGCKNSFATVGIILSIIALVLFVLVFIFYIVYFVLILGLSASEIMNSTYYY